MRIALFEHVTHGFDTIWQCGEDDSVPSDYVRVSEYVDIDFAPMADLDVIKAKCEIIDNEIQRVQAEAHVTTSSLEQRKAELLALPDLS